MVNDIKLNDKYFYADESSKEVKEVIINDSFIINFKQLTDANIKSDLLERFFETKEEAKEYLLEELGLELHQALDDKDGILYNIKELKKNIKNANNKVIFKEIK